MKPSSMSKVYTPKVLSVRYLKPHCPIRKKAVYTVECNECHVIFEVPQTKISSKRGCFCSRACQHKGFVRTILGPKHPRWKGGSCIDAWGYRCVVVDNHPSGRRRIKEHRLVMEHHLGRVLASGEHVHHINHDKLDNRLENLRIMTNSEHRRLHGTKNLQPNVACQLCHKPFYVNKFRLKNTIHFFCSLQHRSIWDIGKKTSERIHAS